VHAAGRPALHPAEPAATRRPGLHRSHAEPRADEAGGSEADPDGGSGAVRSVRHPGSGPLHLPRAGAGHVVLLRLHEPARHAHRGGAGSQGSLQREGVSRFRAGPGAASAGAAAQGDNGGVRGCPLIPAGLSELGGYAVSRPAAEAQGTIALPALADIEAAAGVVYAAMPPTPQYRWPLLGEALGAEVWVKHENHTPIGAFKVRGGLVYFDRLSRVTPRPAGVISATRGNHGQSVGFAARRHGFSATIVVPRGNSVEKNAAM